MIQLGPEELEILNADLNGARGPEQAEVAEAWAAENGYAVDIEEIEEFEDVEEEFEDDLPEEIPEPDDDPEERFSSLSEEFYPQVEAIEKKIGKPLTMKEKLWLIEQIPEGATTVPDFVEAFADQFAKRTTSDEGRLARMAEVVEDVRPPAESKAQDAKRGHEMSRDELRDESHDDHIARMAAVADQKRAELEGDPGPVTALAGMAEEA